MLTRSLLRLPRLSADLVSKQRSRALWTMTTDNHTDLSKALNNVLHHLPSSNTTTTTTTKGTKNVAVVLASRSYDGEQLLKLPSLVPASIRESTTILAAVVNRVPTASGHGVSAMTWTSTASPSSPTTVVPFVLQGSSYKRKRLKEKSVGRWARTIDIEERERLDTPDAWDAFKSISISRNQVELPLAVARHVEMSQQQHDSQSTTDANNGSTSTIPPASRHDQQILVLSDPEVHQFLDALDEVLPQARKAGLIVSSTPFITGEMHTMFYDGQLVRDGVLGLSIVSSSPQPAGESDNSKNGSHISLDSSSESLTTSLLSPPLEILSQPMSITRCRGNIILGLDAQNMNPTRALLEHLEGRNLQKTDEFYIATGPVKSDGQDVDMTAKETKLFKITGGDPSKGNMAVDTVHDLHNGQWVQFMTRKRSEETDRLSQSSSTRAVFQVDEVMIEDVPDKPDEEHKTVQNIFGGSSENGIIMGLPGDFTWVCPIPHAAVSHAVQTTAK